MRSLLDGSSLELVVAFKLAGLLAFMPATAIVDKIATNAATVAVMGFISNILS